MKPEVKPGGPGTPPSPRKAHAEASRRQILETAVKLFARHGYAGTGMRELASSAGVNLAMINYFFGSKKGLLKEILDEFFTGYLEVARRELEQSSIPEPAARLEAFIRGAVNYFSEHRDHLVVVITELPHDDPEVIEHKAAWGKQMMALLGKQVCKPLSAGSQRPLSPLLIGPLLTSMMASRFLFAPISEHMDTDREETTAVDEYAAQLSRLILRGILDFSD
jgi:AcrR family transcriptional regulator